MKVFTIIITALLIGLLVYAVFKYIKKVYNQNL